MTSPAELETSEQYMQIARRWFTAGWTGNLAMADGIFAEDVRTNGVHVGEVRDTAIWHFREGKVVEILTLQDQFAILKQIGYLPESVHAA
jgi:hypothetical protein